MKALGLAVDGDYLFSAVLQKKRNGIKILSLSSSLPEGNEPNVKQFYICKKRFGSAQLVSGLCSKALLIRPLDFQVKNLKDLKKTLPFQEDSLSLLDAKSAMSIPISQKLASGYQVSLFQSPKKILQQHIDKISSLVRSPDTVSCEAMALSRFTHFLCPSLNEYVVFHIGKMKSVCVLIKDQIPVSSYSIDLGTAPFLKALKKDLSTQDTSLSLLEKHASEIDLLTLKKKDYPRLYAEILNFKKESAKVLLSFSKFLDKSPQPMVLTGQMDLFSQLQEILLTGTEEIISHVHHVDEKSKKFSSLYKYAIPIGLALDALRKDSLSIQFRQKEFLPPSFFKRAGNKIATLVLITILGISATVTMLNKRVELEEQKIEEIIQNVYHQNPSLTPKNEQKLSVTKKISLLEEALTKQSSPFPFFLKVPNVTEFLTWLNKTKALTAGIEILDCHYQLETLPTLKTPKAPYKAKASIIFSAESDDQAMLFVQSLQEDPFIKNDKDFSCDHNEMRYKVSFALNEIKKEKKNG